MEVKACMGCFVEWDRERDECPVCGWSPQKPLEEDKNGWHQGKIIAKRFLLGNCYLKKKDFVIWRTYDSLLDIRCYMITSVGGSLTQLLQIAWGFSQQRDKEGCPVVLSMFPVEQVYVLVFSMKEDMDKKDFLSWIMLPKENPKQVIQKLEYLNEKQKLFQNLTYHMIEKEFHHNDIDIKYEEVLNYYNDCKDTDETIAYFDEKYDQQLDQLGEKNET